MRDRAIEIGGATTLIIMALGAVWIQQRIRSAASRQALLLTLDNMSQGIVMIDRGGPHPGGQSPCHGVARPAGRAARTRTGLRRAEADRLGLLIQPEDK